MDRELKCKSLNYKTFGNNTGEIFSIWGQMKMLRHDIKSRIIKTMIICTLIKSKIFCLRKRHC